MSQVKHNAKTDATSLVLAAEVSAVDKRLTESVNAIDQRLSGVISLNEKSVSVALAAAEKAVNAALIAADRAVAKAELAADARFATMNEFRGQLADQAATFLSRVEYTAVQSALNVRIDTEAATRLADTKRIDEKINNILLTQTAYSGKSSGIEEAQTEIRESVAAKLNNRMGILFGGSVFLGVVSIVISILEHH